MTVLSKAAVPMVLLPILTFGLIVAANLVMLALQSVVWAVDGFDPRDLWARLDLPFLWLSLLYGLPFMALWNAPLYAWMLLVSAWARRVPFLWAVAPFVALLIVEHTAFHRTTGHWMLERRFAGAIREPFTVGGDGSTWIERLSDLDPVRLYSLPGLWVGVAVAALFLFAAVRMRRSRGPM
jgi:ABC-2 type transport system permease protein